MNAHDQESAGRCAGFGEKQHLGHYNLFSRSLHPLKGKLAFWMIAWKPVWIMNVFVLQEPRVSSRRDSKLVRQMSKEMPSRGSLTARLCEHLSAAQLLFARLASVSLPSIASFRMSFPVGLDGFSSTKNTKANIAR